MTCTAVCSEQAGDSDAVLPSVAEIARLQKLLPGVV